MKLKDLKEYLDGLSNKDLDRELMVPVYKPGTLGGTPALSVKEISLGFDWDQGVAHVETGEQLTLLSSEEVSAILASVRQGQSYHAMKQIKELKEKIKSSCPHCVEENNKGANNG